jgi:hypothetical protein
MASEDFTLQAQLRAQIASLAEPARVTADGRLICEAGEGDPLEALLREMDETILRRLLTFRSGAAELVLEVSERRLRRVHAVHSAEDLAPDPAWLDGVAPDATAEIAAWLDRFCSDTRSLHVHVGLCTTATDTLALGVPAAALREVGAGHAPDLSFSEAALESLALVEGARASDPRWETAEMTAAHLALTESARSSAGFTAGADAGFRAWQDPASELWIAIAVHAEDEAVYLCAEERVHRLAALWARALP